MSSFASSKLLFVSLILLTTSFSPMFARAAPPSSASEGQLQSERDPRRISDMAGSVEDGLQILAEDIVAKSAASDRTSIAVLPFPNADQTCSVLSTYLADELIQALFSVPKSNLQIVERNQLEAIVNEIKIGAGGLLNPETTQKLGSVSGVKALAIGTITQIGDRIRINARLVATDTGRTVSAAAVTIPRTGDIDNLLRQPVASGSGTCGFRTHDQTTEAAGGVSEPAVSQSEGGASQPGVLPIPDSQSVRKLTIEGITFFAKAVSRTQDKKGVSVVLSVQSTQGHPMDLMFVSPLPSVIDDAANQANANFVSGAAICANWTWDANRCHNDYERVIKTTLTPNAPVVLLMKFLLPEGEFSDGSVSVAASFLVAEASEGKSHAEKPQPKLISLSLANLPISHPRGAQAESGR